MFQIEVQNEHGYPVDEDRLIRASAQVLNDHEVEHGSSVTIVITTDEEVASLNQQFRGISAPTDVLSFPADVLPEELADELEDEPPYLGDLVIAFPYASAQAARENHPLMDSLQLLVVHGTLHLLGYDHDVPENRAQMWAAQARALEALGVSTAIVPALEAAPHHDEDESSTQHG